jgi:hypothetical protein
VPPPEWPWDSTTLSAIATHLGRAWIYRFTPRVAVEQDVAPWTTISFLDWQKTELAVAPRGRHGATGLNNGLYLRRVQRMLFNPENKSVPASMTFVAGKNQITIFADGTYVGGTSADVPLGEPTVGSRPKHVDESAQWESTLRKLSHRAYRLIA